MTDQHPATPPRAGHDPDRADKADRADRAGGEDAVAALASRWFSCAIRTCNLPMSRPQAITLLSGFIDDLGDALRAEPFSAQPGAIAGRDLARSEFVSPDFLGHSIRLLGGGLLAATGVPDTAENRARVVELCGTLAESLTSGLQERLFDKQEHMKTSVIQAYAEVEKERAEVTQRLESVFNSSAIGIALGDLDGQVVRPNAKLCSVLGYTEQEIVGREIFDVVEPPAQQRLRERFAGLRAGVVEHFADDAQWINRDNEPIWVHLTVSLVRDPDDRPAYTVMMLDDTSHEHLLEGRIYDMAVYDELTHLSNLPALRMQIEEALANAGPGDRLALCFFDLDGFKVLNDGLGRSAGNRMLRRVGGILGEVFGQLRSRVARVTGDGFGVLIVGPPSAHTITTLVDDVLTRIEEPDYLTDDTGMAVSASVGIVESAASGVTADELIIAGELTTHRAKMNGKAQWVLYDYDENRRHLDRFRLGATMPGALENGEFVMRYQPVVALSGRPVRWVRSFARWEHPTLGWLAPEEFGDIAQETGVAAAMGKWVLRQVCEQAARWRVALGDHAPAVGLALSVRMANDPELVGRVRRALAEFDIPAESLYLLFPAATLATGNNEATDTLRALAANGVAVAVSGFGGGALTLVDLRDLPLQGVALNPAVSTVMAEAEDGRSPIERGLAELVSYAHGLDVPVVACDVDVVDVASRLGALGVDMGYGHALAEAGTAEEIESRLRPAEPVS